jgi:hypothetical protein
VVGGDDCKSETFESAISSVSGPSRRMAVKTEVSEIYWTSRRHRSEAPMIDPEDMLDRLHADLGWKRLRAGWAKAEIFLGLFVAGVGICLMIDRLSVPLGGATSLDLGRIVGIIAFMLGGYLAMAGHRSHLYQSNNTLAAWIASVLSQRRSEPSEQIKELR